MLSPSISAARLVGIGDATTVPQDKRMSAEAPGFRRNRRGPNRRVSNTRTTNSDDQEHPKNQIHLPETHLISHPGIRSIIRGQIVGGVSRLLFPEMLIQIGYHFVRKQRVYNRKPGLHRLRSQDVRLVAYLVTMTRMGRKVLLKTPCLSRRRRRRHISTKMSCLSFQLTTSQA